VRLLIDSHVALWWIEDNPYLGATARGHITAADEVVFSAVTPWELGITRALGKLTMPDGLADALVAGGFRALDISAHHAETAAALPAHHGDPFDRMLIAQAQLESLRLVTADRAFDAYDVDLMDALA